MSSETTDTSTQTCPLSWPQQRWNLILFALCTGTQYLAAPVLYVGITQASLCDRLGADARTSNLPGTLFFAMTAVPALIAWLSPQVSALRRNLSLCYAASALMLATLAITLAAPVSTEFKLAMIALQGAVSGAVMPAAIAFLWEVIGRGSDESRRGLALGLAFGAGPLLAVLGSFGQTALLGGNLFGYQFAGYEYPRNFIILFGAGAPIMAVSAILSQFFIISPVAREAEREPIRSVIGLLIGLPLMFVSIALTQVAAQGQSAQSQTAQGQTAPGQAVSTAGANELQTAEPVTAATANPEAVSVEGILRRIDPKVLELTGYLFGLGAAAALIYHFRSVLQQRVLLLATIVTILVYAGNVIPANMNLYSREALNDLPEKYAGVQNMLRFSFKVVAGVLLGWFLTRTSPKAGVLATSTIFVLALVWATCVTGPWYLIAFGMHGAGELVGVYAPNYIVSASRSDQLRRNMAFVTMLMVPAAPAGILYGAIVDSVKAQQLTLWGMNSETLGFRLSFVVCALLISVGIILAATMLPAKPRPETA